MGKRKKPGAAMLAASSKLGRFAFLSAKVSAPSVKSATTPEDSAPLIDAKVVQETKLTVVPEIGVDTTATPSQCHPPVPFQPQSPLRSMRLRSTGLYQCSFFAVYKNQTFFDASGIGNPDYSCIRSLFVLIPDENIDAAKEEFKDFVFARFTGDTPPKGHIIGVVNAMWTRTGPRIFVHRIGEGAFFLQVTNERTRATILSRQAWMIKGCPMFVST
ncbi:unnamed protein product [Brassica oleracea var. botrytis]